MICFTRVDDRLIHGQVRVTWINATHTKLILIVDDKTSKDPVAQQILSFAAPEGIKLKTVDTEAGIAEVMRAMESTEETMVLFKTILTAKRLADAGVHFKEINVGPVSAKPGASKYAKNTYFLPEEAEAANQIANQGTHIYLQLTPDSFAKEWSTK